ncbi:hypothetical protein [uncultured Draconibacterium sp.]|uniref:hypothetical protein n=1 Tax=uncultured Draconibacterium sp. TaxID=1573823 RepID=UPI0026331604|nr:hypothetical protein [uncultured Draconibacterium sp.]
MKLRNLFLLGVLLLSLFACDDANTDYTTETKMIVDIPTESYLVSLSESTETYHFDGIGVFCLGYSDDIKDCPGDVVHINPGVGSTLSFEALQNNETIEELQLVISFKTQGDDDYQQIHSVDLLQAGKFLSGDTHSLELDDVLAPLINRLNENPRYLISIEINGLANFDLSSDAQFEIPLIIESEYTSPRFTL